MSVCSSHQFNLSQQMKFDFQSSAVRTELMQGSSRRSIDTPAFVADALHELGQQVRGMRFEVNRYPGQRSVRFVDSSYTDVCAIVDWAGAIHSKICGELSTEALVLGNEAHNLQNSRSAFIGVLEYWHEFDQVNEPVYLCPVRYPHPYLLAAPNATLGNMCAAFGLAIVDRLLARQGILSMERQHGELGAAWQCAVLASRHNHLDIVAHLHGWSNAQQ